MLYNVNNGRIILLFKPHNWLKFTRKCHYLNTIVGQENEQLSIMALGGKYGAKYALRNILTHITNYADEVFKNLPKFYNPHIKKWMPYELSQKS